MGGDPIGRPSEVSPQYRTERVGSRTSAAPPGRLPAEPSGTDPATQNTGALARVNHKLLAAIL